ncbi:hypothetical protein M5D96_005335, partial [Drosophila gunungcola]
SGSCFIYYLVGVKPFQIKLSSKSYSKQPPTNFNQTRTGTQTNSVRLEIPKQTRIYKVRIFKLTPDSGSDNRIQLSPPPKTRTSRIQHWYPFRHHVLSVKVKLAYQSGTNHI